jgi:predicted RNA binding protein YcfA (HicA-like mRNA interferase family)
MTSAEPIRLMKKGGWVLRGSKGSHRIFVHPQRPGHISVPHPKKQLGVGLLEKLLKQAGLK